MSTDNDSSGCGGLLALLVLNLILGGWTVQYLVEFWVPLLAHHAANAPFWPCALAGLFVGEISAPLAAATWVLHSYGAF